MERQGLLWDVTEYRQHWNIKSILNFTFNLISARNLKARDTVGCRGITPRAEFFSVLGAHEILLITRSKPPEATAVRCYQ